MNQDTRDRIEQHGERLIIAGSRDLEETRVRLLIDRELGNASFHLGEIVSGGARGVDNYGEHWARENDVPLTIFRADWQRYGKQSGFIRNREMAVYADRALVIWDGTSHGAANMASVMTAIGKPIRLVEIPASSHTTHAEVEIALAGQSFR